MYKKGFLSGNWSFALRITIIYIFLGALWILFSDKLMFAFFRDTNTLNLVSTYKGWFYVLLTGWLLFLLVRQELRKRSTVESELKIALAKAEESEKLKAAFLNNISHEIRTPLNAIIGFSELIVNPDLTIEQKSDFSGYIKRGTTDLIDTIEDILIVSRIQVGEMKLEMSKESVLTLVEDIVKYYDAQLKNQKGKEHVHLILNYSLVPDDSFIIADFRHLKQILNKLLSNAIKFSESGTIILSCSKSPANEILFSVEDSGCGIPEAKKEVIFNPFRQAEEAILSKRTGGNGLGLSIAKGLVELMNGKIWFESEVGKGSIFYFSVPDRTN